MFPFIQFYSIQQMEIQSISLKILVAGDAAVGKTSIIHSYLFDNIPSQSTTATLDNQTKNIKLDGRSYNLSIWEPSADPSYDKIRSISYSNIDILFLVFSVREASSFNNSYTKWLQQVIKHSPQAIVIFVANKIDLRQKKVQKSVVRVESQGPAKAYLDVQVGKEQAKKKIQQQMGHLYLQCSALTREGIQNIFKKGISEWNARAEVQRKRFSLDRKQLQRKKNFCPCSCCQIM